MRDVLERDIITQLRKIAFSALVYGGLVVVCLGAVVWGLSYAFVGVLLNEIDHTLDESALMCSACTCGYQ